MRSNCSFSLFFASALLACSSDQTELRVGAPRADGGSANTGSGEATAGMMPDCLESVEPFTTAHEAELAIDLAPLRTAAEAEHEVPLRWRAGGEVELRFRLERPSYLLVRSRENPAVGRHEFSNCSDHLRIEARALLQTNDGKLDETLTALKLRADPRATAARGVAGFDRAALRGSYAPLLSTSECFTRTQLDLELDTVNGLRGSMRDHIVYAPCDAITATSGVSPRDAASFGSDGQACTLERQVAKRKRADSSNCGTVPATGSSEQFELAQKCVLDALAAGRPFHVIAWMRGFDSSVAEGFVWKGAGEPIARLSYDSDPSGGGGSGATVGEQTCSTLVASEPSMAGPRPPFGARLRLSCTTQGLASPVCRGPATRTP